MRPESTRRSRGHAHGFGCQCGAPRTRVAVRCPVCRVMFEAKPSELRRGKQWCSWPCYQAGKQRNDVDAAQHAWRRVDTTGEHWPFLGAANSAGYGNVKLNGRWKLMSHVAWFLATGAWPERGQIVGHTLDCGADACCRNDEVGTWTVGSRSYPRRGHLFLTDERGNTHDKIAKNRRPRGGELHQSDLTEADIIEILTRAAGGESRTSIARSKGVIYPPLK